MDCCAGEKKRFAGGSGLISREVELAAKTERGGAVHKNTEATIPKNPKTERRNMNVCTSTFYHKKAALLVESAA